MKLLFETAVRRQPCLLFFDEVDSIASKRTTGGDETTAKLKNLLLTSMNLIKDLDIFVVAATNLPWFLDDAFLRRFDKDVYIPLPDESSRASLFALYLRNIARPIFTDLEFHVFATLTPQCV